ncbi:SH2 domain-containing protein 7-like [Carcharodon carcharias]|uniref:SH2 domain-containing protein 7-like n=1 Tax=Carcharodon carcharias TaxID=13397 RepID=UPI001B7E0CE2|nr:SH2 domain-containing protein 7-like [Carcharodon carcharias]
MEFHELDQLSYTVDRDLSTAWSFGLANGTGFSRGNHELEKALLSCNCEFLIRAPINKCGLGTSGQHLEGSVVSPGSSWALAQGFYISASMKANCKLVQHWSSQDNVSYGRPLFQSAPLSFMLPHHSVSQGKRIHNFSKSKGIWPYLKLPQFKASGFGESQRQMSSSRKLHAGSDTMVVGMLKEMALRWFTETQAALILQNGRLPEWFHGFATRREAENFLRDRGIGHFLVRLSDKAIGYILSYKGTDRCRHFVIQQSKNGRYIIDGSIHTHESLAALINYYMTEAIQPFGEVLTEACSQYERSNLYDQISFSLPNSSHSEEAEGKEPVARRPGGNPQSEEGPRRPPAVPPKAKRAPIDRQLNSSLESVSSNSEDSDIAPPLPIRSSLIFEEENQDRVMYRKISKFKSNEKSPSAVLNEEFRIMESLTNPLYSVGMDVRKPQLSGRLPPTLSEPSNAIYSLAVEPQRRYNEVFEPTRKTSSPEIVYTEVDLKQWKTGTLPTAHENNYTTISAPTEQLCQSSEGRSLSLTTPPSTPPRLSPNLNHRVKPPSPTHPSQKQEANQKLPPNLWPLPQLADFNERLLLKDSLYGATLGVRSSTKSPENTYEQIPDKFSKRNQAKPAPADKDEVRKKWFSDWKYK